MNQRIFLTFKLKIGSSICAYLWGVNFIPYLCVMTDHDPRNKKMEVKVRLKIDPMMKGHTTHKRDRRMA